MSTRLVCSVCCLLVLSITGAAWGDIVGQWEFDEGSGAIVNDSSGNGHHGKILGTPVWVAGPGGVGTALGFGDTTCTGVDCGVFDPTKGTGKFTFALWAFWDGTGTFQHLLTKTNGWGATTMMFQVELWGAHTDATYTDRLGISYDPVSVPFAKMPKNQWVHLAFVYDGANLRLYLNGLDEQGPKALTIGSNINATVFIARDYNGGRVFHGRMDDVRIYGQTLTPGEIKEVMTGPAKLAGRPNPADGAIDVPRDTSFGWLAGRSAATHDVYLGKTLADVNNASRTAPAGLLASQGQTATAYTPTSALAYGQTYYWRIDEVNAAPDNTVFKGNIWSFTVEPYGYPVKPMAATASSAQPSMGPENTINGSGLTGDLHGTDGPTMWLSTGVQPNWIQYQFDKAYKLYDLKVWNSNQLVESFIGFGAKKMTIEYSADGTTWTALGSVPEFARATGMPGYAANTTVNLGGVLAKYVKLTINSTWGGVSPVTGLSEVRFSSVPVQAFAPQPATAATGVAIDVGLSWRPGREAGAHKVFFGTDQAAVAAGTAAAQTVADHGYAPGALNYGTTYYWRVDEVNTVTYPGEVWSFTTQEYAAVDDFESYNDGDKRIYDSWIDGFTDGKSGSTVGYMTAPFAETTILHGGKQSMPFEYNNVKTPYYSEASRTFEAAQNWTTNGADIVSVCFRGRAAGFLDNGNGTFTVSASGSDIWNNADQFRFAYKALNGNGSITARVDSIGNTNVWAKACVMIRETLDAGSKNACIAVTPGSGISFQWRDTANGVSANSGTAGLVAPYWVRITRTGNVFKAEYSPDGKTWAQQGANMTVTMGASVYIGLAVTSHDAALTTVTEISNVSATGTITGSWQDVAIGMAMPTNGAAPLYLMVEDKAGKTKTVVNPNPSASATAAWTQWKIPLSSLTGVNTAAVKKITLGVGDKINPKAGAAGMLYFDDIGYGHSAK